MDAYQITGLILIAVFVAFLALAVFMTDDNSEKHDHLHDEPHKKHS